jgi:hypothetical protein
LGICEGYEGQYPSYSVLGVAKTGGAETGGERSVSRHWIDFLPRGTEGAWRPEWMVWVRFGEGAVRSEHERQVGTDRIVV